MYLPVGLHVTYVRSVEISHLYNNTSNSLYKAYTVHCYDYNQGVRIEGGGYNRVSTPFILTPCDNMQSWSYEHQ